MKYFVINTPPIRWKIKANSLPQRVLLSLPGFSILNPLFYPEGDGDIKIRTNSSSKVKENYLITTTGIILKQKANTNDDSVAIKVWEYIALFFRYLRFESMHPGIKSNNFIHVMRQIDKVKKEKVELQDSSVGMYAPIYNTMITWENVKNADNKIAKEIKIKIPEEILIDAFDALLDRQFDKTILFSAIAVESSLANFFDEVYERKIKSVKSNLKIITDHKGNIKDPIFKILFDRNDFSKLLHEIPLYLLNKSIYLEKEQLYTNLIKLYKTRNKIVHWGAPLEDNESERIPLNEKGANLAFDIALDTFAWLGINRFEILRHRKGIFVK